MEIEDLNRSVNIQVNGQPIEIKLEFNIEEDDIWTYDDSFEPSKGCFCAWIEVKALALGLEGHDSIGGCSIHCNNMFDSSKFESDVNQTIETHEMIESAINHLKEQLESRYSELIKEAETFKAFAK